MTTIRLRVRELRKRRKWSLRKLAQRAGVRPDQASLVLTDASLLEIVRAGIVDDRGRAHEHARFEELPHEGLRGFWL